MLSEIGALHLGHVEQFLARSAEHDPAAFQHVAAVGDRSACAGVLLDQQDRCRRRCCRPRCASKIASTSSARARARARRAAAAAAPPSARGRSPASAARRRSASRRAGAAARAGSGTARTPRPVAADAAAVAAAKAPMRRFSSTVMLPNNCRRSGTWHEPRAHDRGGGMARRSLAVEGGSSPAATGSSPITVLQQRALAGAVRADQRDDLARAHVERRRRAAPRCGRSRTRRLRSQATRSSLHVARRDRPRSPPGRRALRPAGRRRSSGRNGTVTRSARPMTSRMSCSTSRIVMPRAECGAISRSSSSVSVSFRPAAGSSISSSVGCGGERARDLEQALVAERQIGRPGRRRRQPDEAQQLERARRAASSSARGTRGACTATPARCRMAWSGSAGRS